MTRWGEYSKEQADADIAVHAALTKSHGVGTAIADTATLTAHAARLAAHTASFMQKIRVGAYFHPWIFRAHADNAAVASTLYLMPFLVARNLTIDRLAIDITIGGAAGKIARLGIYADGTDCYPGALVLDAGTVAVDGTGVVAAVATQALTVPEDEDTGLYWLALVSDGTPTMTIGYSAIPLLGQTATDFTQGFDYSCWSKAAVGSGALANPCVAGGAVALYGFLILPRLLTLD